MTTLADTLGKFVQRRLYSHTQVALLSGVPKNTISNWLSGRVAKPHQWPGLVKVAAALHLTESETDTLLQSAGHLPLAQLRLQADEKTRLLLQPWPAKAEAPFQAIPDLPYFVGREDELTRLRDLLQQRRQLAIVSLHGMGGVGKTALAAHIAYDQRHLFPDGVLWVRLDSGNTMATLTMLAGVYGVDVSRYNTVESRSTVVRALLADKKALLILDNADNSDQVAPLLPPTTGHCRVLVTSRHDLAVLDGWPQLAIQPFSTSSEDALALFSHFLGEASVKQAQPLLLEIANLVGQLPLALAIIAAQLARNPTPTAIADMRNRLHREDEKLTTIERENRGIRATFNDSFARLDAPLQRFFTSLGAFGGDDFSVEAAAFVAETDLATAATALQTLHQLSLVQESQHGRFRLHLLLRDFAREKLNGWPNPDQIYQRMIQYFMQLADVKETAASSERAMSPAMVVEEINNLQAAMEIAQQRSMFRTLFQAVRAFFVPLHEYGLWPMLEAPITTLLREIDQQEDVDMAVELLIMQSRLRWWREQGGADLIQQALQLAQHAEEPHLMADALRGLGRWLNRQNRLAEGEQVALQALEIAESIDDPIRVVAILNNLGHALLNQDKVELAQHYLERGYHVAKSIAYYRTLVILTSNLGTLHAEKFGNWETGLAYFAEGAEIGRTHNCQTVLMGHLGSWGYEALFVDELELARDTFQESLAIAKANNHQVSIAVRLADLGEVARREKQFSEAADYFQQAIDIAKQETLSTWLPIMQLRYGLLLQDQGRLSEAQAMLSPGWETRHLLHRAYARELNLIAAPMLNAADYTLDG